MKRLFVFCLFLISFSVADDYDDESTDEQISEMFSEAISDATAPLPEVVAKYNYTIEVHNVTTEDGYILTMHRIPATPTSPAADSKPIAFLMHGLICSSDVWITMGPGKSIAYVLADAGYDVWMGNTRGSAYSKRHDTNLTEEEFWDFTWHEMGIYDLPAMIDYALETTGEETIIFIGHSQGTTTFFVMASEIPSYNDKIKAMFALGPCAYMGNLYNPILQTAASSTTLLTDLVELFGEYKVFDFSRSARAAIASFCTNNTFICSNLIFLLCGFDQAQMNVTLLPTLFGHLPSSSSVLQIAHYGQLIQSHKFRQYDQGIIQNFFAYGSLSPPNYNMSLITAPVHLVYADNDWLVAEEDVVQLYSELGNPAEMWHVTEGNWTHFDFLWGIDAKTVINDPLLEILETMYSE